MDPTGTKQNRRGWRADWRTSLLTAVFLPILLGLGFWQLERAAEKLRMAEAWAARRSEQATGLLALPADPDSLAYRRVLLRGNFLQGRDFLLDNRLYQRRYGVEVISPFRMDEGDAVVLVNRGWLEADPTRRSLPDIPPGADSPELRGSIYIPPGKPFTLGAIGVGTQWPRLVQAADVSAMAEMLERPVYPYIVRLDQDSPAALTIDWPLVNISSRRGDATKRSRRSPGRLSAVRKF